MLSGFESEQTLLNNDSESPDGCDISNNEEANAFGTGKEVRKLFAGIVWYSGMVESSREHLNGSSTYTFWFEDGEYE